MDLSITPKTLNGKVVAPPSKSYAHRILICAYLSGKKVKVNISEFSEDIKATLRVLVSFGAIVQYVEGGVILEKGQLPKTEIICDAGESGSTLRFLLPVAVALGLKAKFVGAKRLLERPISPLVSVLNEHGGRVKVSAEYILVNGKLDSGKFVIDGSLSSQYVTGLLLALSFLGEKSVIETVGKKVSGGYVDITLDTLRKFGVNIETFDNLITVVSNRQSEIDEITVEGDWSNAAFLLAGGVIGGNVSVAGLNANSMQGDREIIDALKSFGGDITFSNGEFIAKKSSLKGTSLDIDKIPDLAQILSVVGAYAQGVTVLKNTDRLRLKESDRINAIVYNLQAVGVNAKYVDGDIVIVGGKVQGGTLLGFNDHRAVMSACITATYAEGKSTVCGTNAVNKSFPTFFEKFEILRNDK